MTFNQECVGNYFSLSKGLGYLGKYLSSSNVGLIGLNSFDEGGSYKYGGEKEYSGPFKPEHIASPGDLFISTTDITQDGRVLASPMLLPDLSAEFDTIIFSGDIVKAVPRLNGLLPEFLYNILRVKRYRDKAAYASTGTTVRRIPTVVIEQLVVPVPPLETQNAIIKLIRSIDEKIALNSRMSTQLEELAQTIFKSWFIDFDPVKAKMAGRTHADMDDATAVLFPDSMEDSEVGQIPSGWIVKSLQDIASQRKENVRFEDLSADDAYVGLDIIPRKSLFFSNWESAEGVQSGKTRFFPKDILFGKLRPYFHKVVVAPISGICSTDVVVLCAAEVDLLPYVACLVNQTSFVDFLSNRSTGTRMPRTSWKEMCEFRFASPPDAVLKQFGQITLSTFELALELQMQVRTLVELRDTLLPRLISGELQIPEEMLVP